METVKSVKNLYNAFSVVKKQEEEFTKKFFEEYRIDTSLSIDEINFPNENLSAEEIFSLYKFSSLLTSFYPGNTYAYKPHFSYYLDYYLDAQMGFLLNDILEYKIYDSKKLKVDFPLPVDYRGGDIVTCTYDDVFNFICLELREYFDGLVSFNQEKKVSFSEIKEFIFSMLQEKDPELKAFLLRNSFLKEC